MLLSGLGVNPVLLPYPRLGSWPDFIRRHPRDTDTFCRFEPSLELIWRKPVSRLGFQPRAEKVLKLLLLRRRQLLDGGFDFSERAHVWKIASGARVGKGHTVLRDVFKRGRSFSKQRLIRTKDALAPLRETLLLKPRQGRKKNRDGDSYRQSNDAGAGVERNPAMVLPGCFLNASRHPLLMEIVFSVTQEADGGCVADCLSHDIFTQADDWEQLRVNVREAVTAIFFDQPAPTAIRLHLVRDELLAVA